MRVFVARVATVSYPLTVFVDIADCRRTFHLLQVLEVGAQLE